MRLFDLFGKDTVDPLWEFTTSGVLWHLRAVDSRFLVGEERDPEAKQAAFFCLDQTSGHLLWRDSGFGDQWWIGISTVIRDTLLLHGFSSPDMPLPHGIIAVNIPTGKKLWGRPDLVLRGVAGENLVGEAATMSGSAFFEISLQDGTTHGSVDSTRAEDFPLPDDPVEFPVLLEEAVAGNPGLLERIEPFISGRMADAPVEVFLHNSRIAVSFHEQRPESTTDNPHYRHILLMIDTGQQRTIFKRILDADTTRVVPDPFFVFRETLYCIRERRTLIAVPVGASRDSSFTS